MIEDFGPRARRLGADRPQYPAAAMAPTMSSSSAIPPIIPISKAGSTAHFEADTVVDNLASLVQEDRWSRDYDGKVFCFIETGMNTGTYVWFNYTTPPKSESAVADGPLVQARLQPDVLAVGARLTVRRPGYDRNRPFQSAAG